MCCRKMCSCFLFFFLFFCFVFFVFSFPSAVYVGTLNLIASIPGPSILTLLSIDSVCRFGTLLSPCAQMHRLEENILLRVLHWNTGQFFVFYLVLFFMCIFMCILTRDRDITAKLSCKMGSFQKQLFNLKV